MAAALFLSRIPTASRAWRPPAINAVPLPHCLQPPAPPTRAPSLSLPLIQRMVATAASRRPIPPPAAPGRLVFPSVGDVTVIPPAPPTGSADAPPPEWRITFSPPPPIAPPSTTPPPRPDQSSKPSPPGTPPNEASTRRPVRRQKAPRGLPVRRQGRAVRRNASTKIPPPAGPDSDESDVRSTAAAETREASVEDGGSTVPGRDRYKVFDIVGRLALIHMLIPQPLVVYACALYPCSPEWLRSLARDPKGGLTRFAKAYESSDEVKLRACVVAMTIGGAIQWWTLGEDATTRKAAAAVLKETNQLLLKFFLPLSIGCTIKSLQHGSKEPQPPKKKRGTRRIQPEG